MNSKKIFFSLAGFTLLASFLFCLFSFAFVFSANETSESGGNLEEIDALKGQIDAKKKKIAELERSIAEFKKKIEEKRLEAVSLSNQIGILDTRISELDTDIAATQQKLDILHLEIASSELLISQKEEQILKQKQIAGELIRSIHEYDAKSYIEIAANHETFSDFYNQLYYTKAVEEDLGRTMRGVRIAKEELEGKKQELENQKKSYTEVANELKEKRAHMQEQSFAKEMLLTEAKTSQVKYNTLLNNLKAQYQQIENEISGIERQMRKKLEKSNKIDEKQKPDTGKMSWPVPSKYVTATFHDPSYPFRHVFEHSGMDIRASQGTAVKATASGYIGRAKKCTLASCYSYVLILHDGGLSTVYGHLSKVVVSEDQFVTRGDIIGYSGGTPGTAGAGPFVTGAHLHFEVRKDGIPVNPANYIE